MARTLRSGRRGRLFKSGHPELIHRLILDISKYFLINLFYVIYSLIQTLVYIR